jgi:translation elongation factor EF-Tu-like GTPase
MKTFKNDLGDGKSSMKTFKSDDSFKIAGRGMVKTVKIPNPDCVMKPEGMPEVGEIVKIDAGLYEVRGVEMFMKLMYPPHPGENAGLLVTPLTCEEQIQRIEDARFIESAINKAIEES